MLRLRQFSPIDREYPIYEVVDGDVIILDVTREDGGAFEIAFHDGARGVILPLADVEREIATAKALLLQETGLPDVAAPRNGELQAQDLSSIQGRCDAATPGPWHSSVEGRDHVSGSSFIRTGEGSLRGEDIELSGASAADQDFIAHARVDVPRLLAEVRRLRRAIGGDF